MPGVAATSIEADLTFGPAETDADLKVFGDIVSHGFGFPPEDAAPWFARAGHDNIRLLRRRTGIVGGLVEIPMGQYFGGRSVRMMGVAGVGIAPEERGRGVAAKMMVAMLREAKAAGYALSTLYPASITLYRRAGYERAGARFTFSLDPRHLEVPRVKDVTVSELSGTTPEVVALYDGIARRSPGWLDRGPYVWSRVTHPRKLSPKLFGFAFDGNLEGYVAVDHGFAEAGNKLTVTDLVARSTRAASAILRHLAEYRSLATTVKWNGPSTDIVSHALPERHVAITLEDYFMVRIVDVERAFALRGWPISASGSLVFEVDDASMPENSGRYPITVERGSAAVTRGPNVAPVVRIHERGLAALYTGHATPDLLADLGWLEASPEALALLGSWFHGPAPSMRDFF